MHIGPRQACGAATGNPLRLHRPATGQDLWWLLVTHGVLAPEEAARMVQPSVGAQVAGQEVEAIAVDLGDYVDMVLL
eukprot:206713-Alexandrium_andersonii.AAC.1